MNETNNIALNFSPLKLNEFTFKLYRRKRENDEKKPDNVNIFGSRLPASEGKEDYDPYWVSFLNFENSEEYKVHQSINHNLTKSYLLFAVKNYVTENLKNDQFYLDSRTKYNRIYFILQLHKEGKEAIWIQPYYLKKTRQFGFLIDFHFFKDEHSPFSRKQQILSLSLNSFGRSNTEFYSDKYKKIRLFAKLYYNDIFKETAWDFKPTAEIPYDILEQKTFLVQNNREVDSQSKMRNIGPLKGLNQEINIFFLHKESERKLLATFYKQLQSELENVFKVKIKLNGHICTEISQHETIKLRNKIINQQHSNPIVIVLKKSQEEENEMYYSVKYEFSKESIPVQFINYKTLQNKYSVRDFSLQIFSKVGGVPWLIKPKNETTLIIGLAQSIRYKDENGKKMQDRYYAYSILLDSTGLYNSIDIVSSNSSKAEYLRNLSEKLQGILAENENKYNRIAIHAPFKISKDEIYKIKETIGIINLNIDFVVIKINIHNKYFGYNKAINNLTPLEGSCTSLSDTDYLLWTEGLSQGDFKPKKRYSGPTHISFMWQNKANIDHKSYIQELLSLSGMNWRAYNSKSTPVSVQYCKLVTDFVREFKERGYPELKATSLQPWFL